MDYVLFMCLLHIGRGQNLLEVIVLGLYFIAIYIYIYIDSAQMSVHYVLTCSFIVETNVWVGTWFC